MSAARRRLRVVTLIDQLAAQGGAERVATQLATRIDPERFDSTICASRHDPAEPQGNEYIVVQQLEQHGTRVVGLGRGGRFELHKWWPLVRLLRSERVDVLHTHLFGSNVYGTIIGRLARVPVIVAHEHTWSYEGKPVRKLLDRELIARFASRFVAVSREDRRRMIEVERIDPERITIVPNGIDEVRPVTGSDPRAELGIAPDAPLVAAVGVLRGQKAFDVLIRAAARLAPRVPGIRVVIVGSGPEGPALEALIDSLGVRDTVVMAGFRKDVPDLLAALDVAVCSSDFEGSPLAVMEYMDAGKPIVATRVGGVPDLIDDGVHGLLVPARDDTALADAIERVVTDRALAERLGRAARERRQRELGFENTVRAVEELYEQLYAQTARGRAEGFTPAFA